MEYTDKFTLNSGKYKGKTIYIVKGHPENEFFQRSSYKEFLDQEVHFDDKKYKIIGIEHIRPFIPDDYNTMGFMVNEIRD